MITALLSVPPSTMYNVYRVYGAAEKRGQPRRVSPRQLKSDQSRASHPLGAPIRLVHLVHAEHPGVATMAECGKRQTSDTGRNRPETGRNCDEYDRRDRVDGIGRKRR